MVTRRSRKKGLREGEVTKTSWILNQETVISGLKRDFVFLLDIENEEVKLKSPYLQNEAPKTLA